MMLLVCEIREGLSAPDFGPEYCAHAENKRHPGHRTASISAWRLLEAGMRRLGYEKMPEVRFLENGKTVFADEKLNFSLSHSGKLAAAVISEESCAVDVEICGRMIEEKLKKRCMHENEIAAGMNFFECWTKKECIGKLSGRGMPSRPCEIDLTAEETGFFCERISDSNGQEYRLSATCGAKIEWVEL